MQPGGSNVPKRPLKWGQLQVGQTTDTHGWLEGHLKQPTYSANWGDFRSFYDHMNKKAQDLDVDLIWVDCGDLHDGTGFSDNTDPHGLDSMPIYDEVSFDIMTIGNHELYLADVTYDMYTNWAKKWGDRYLTSNVLAFNQTSQQYEYIGAKSRYFTTAHGLRIRAFGVLFTFTGNSNASKIIPAEEMITQPWFTEVLESHDPVDVFILSGHNAVRPTDPTSTMKVVFDAIRARHPDTPILVLGGHTHVRDFIVYDESGVGLEAGRYCETFGWVSLSGFDCSNSGWTGVDNPRGVPNPSRPATPDSTSPWVWSRRYLDFSRNSFMYHTQRVERNFDTSKGLDISKQIGQVRTDLNLGEVLGCVPQSFCIFCVEVDDPGSIFSGLLAPAASMIIVNETRAEEARFFIINTGAARYDLPQGPFTIDDIEMVTPFPDVITYIPDVPLALAKQVLAELNDGSHPSKRDQQAAVPLTPDACTDPSFASLQTRDLMDVEIVRRHEALTPGYNTTDDWGNDGDDIPHNGIPLLTLPDYFGFSANFPDNTEPDVVDLITLDL
ncbi:Uncharacterized protein ESCO_001262 [Escovopsis weberi]|uniref:Putative 5'-nucleotidase C-terminal domain-containing protein n=1 Tax=Escovopsis weberi TaxID=150374 RepID=A0A0N0RT96_ESCWE|nr:Uncharacterized protein ESCO_001262 [Escovopsis weberi]